MAKKKVKSNFPTRSKRAHTKPRVRAKKFLQRQTTPTAAPQYIPWTSVELEILNPLLQRQFVVGQEIMLARVLLKKGCIVPEHSHHNEQLTYIVDGALKFWIDGKEIIVSAGEVLCIPANVPHKAEALQDTVDLDIFTPPRADWIDKTDQYLRGTK
jgi:quercetin dioxygenase-like cupin family protein